MGEATKKHCNAILFVAIVILPIAVGSAIYVGWRAQSLLVFEWMAACRIPIDVFRPATNLPRSILYSLPDGCWVFAGTSWTLIIWQRLHPWAFVFVVLAIGGEVGQAIQIVPGIFDWNDIAFYAIGFILPVMGLKHATTRLICDCTYRHDCACRR